MALGRDLGTPNLVVAGLSLWVHRREYDSAPDYWDSNWLNVTVRCRYPGAEVWAEGTFLRTDEIDAFRAGCMRLDESVVGAAELVCLEPNLAVHLEADRLGHVKVRIRLTHDHLQQSHEFLDQIDQTFLGPIVRQCADLLSRFPVVGSPNA
jgi:hypothetical protein